MVRSSGRPTLSGIEILDMSIDDEGAVSPSTQQLPSNNFTL